MGLFNLFAAKRTCPPKSLDLPEKRADVAEWQFPVTLDVPAYAQAQALVALFKAEGRTGAVPHTELLSRYPEFAMDRGFVEVSERAMLKALGQVCERHRPYPEKIVCYVVPGPNTTRHMAKRGANVVPLRGRIKPQIRADVDDIPWPDMAEQAVV